MMYSSNDSLGVSEGPTSSAIPKLSATLRVSGDGTQKVRNRGRRHGQRSISPPPISSPEEKEMASVGGIRCAGTTSATMVLGSAGTLGVSWTTSAPFWVVS